MSNKFFILLFSIIISYFSLAVGGARSFSHRINTHDMYIGATQYENRKIPKMGRGIPAAAAQSTEFTDRLAKRNHPRVDDATVRLRMQEMQAVITDRGKSVASSRKAFSRIRVEKKSSTLIVTEFPRSAAHSAIPINVERQQKLRSDVTVGHSVPAYIDPQLKGVVINTELAGCCK